MNFLKKAAAYDAALAAFNAAGIDLSAVLSTAAADPEKLTEGLLNALGEQLPAEDAVALADLTAEHPAVAPLIEAAVTKANQAGSAQMADLLSRQLATSGIQIAAADITDADKLKTAITDRQQTYAAEFLAQRGFAPGDELDEQPNADATKPGAKARNEMHLSEFLALSHSARSKFRRSGGKIVADPA